MAVGAFSLLLVYEIGCSVPASFPSEHHAKGNAFFTAAARLPDEHELVGARKLDWRQPAEDPLVSVDSTPRAAADQPRRPSRGTRHTGRIPPTTTRCRARPPRARRGSAGSHASRRPRTAPPTSPARGPGVPTGGPSPAAPHARRPHSERRASQTLQPDSRHRSGCSRTGCRCPGRPPGRRRRPTQSCAARRLTSSYRT